MEIQFPIQLKKLRTGLSMSQEDIAGKLYISRQAVSRWESGDATPDMSNLIKLAEIFDCSLDTLVLGIEPKQDNIDDRINKWWVAIPILVILGGIIPDIIQAFK
ncbi:helix-turn-helix domain-containing protein [Leuconostoc sp. JNUCC 76]